MAHHFFSIAGVHLFCHPAVFSEPSGRFLRFFSQVDVPWQRSPGLWGASANGRCFFNRTKVGGEDVGLFQGKFGRIPGWKQPAGPADLSNMVQPLRWPWSNVCRCICVIYAYMTWICIYLFMYTFVALYTWIIMSVGPVCIWSRLQLFVRLTCSFVINHCTWPPKQPIDSMDDLRVSSLDCASIVQQEVDCLSDARIWIFIQAAVTSDRAGKTAVTCYWHHMVAGFYSGKPLSSQRCMWEY